MNRKAKIVATLGPACENERTLEKLLSAGVNVVRLNFSHGNHEQHAVRIAAVRSIAERMNISVGILQDLQGPKIRIGTLPTPIQLTTGQRLTLYLEGTEVPVSAEPALPVDFRQLFESVQRGEQLLLDDGRLTLEIVSVAEHTLLAEVIVGGLLTSHKGINLPGIQLRISGYTTKDEADLKFGIAQGVDAVAVSFVRTAEDVIQVREAMERFANGKPTPMLIAKLERPEAIENLDAILDVVDGVMVARGDLGVEVPPERVPVLQKMIINKASLRGKLVITATQMLESMIQNPLPTRAEVSDVANAIFDGTDALMLSAETTSGQHPVESVAMMVRVIEEAESHFSEWGSPQRPIVDVADSDAASMAHAAHALANDRDVTAVAVFTSGGATARLISKIRPMKQILAFTPDLQTYRKLAFLWGVAPQLVPFVSTLETMLEHLDAALLQTGIKPGEQVILVCGFPVGSMRPPNMALLHVVGE